MGKRHTDMHQAGKTMVAGFRGFFLFVFVFCVVLRPGISDIYRNKGV